MDSAGDFVVVWATQGQPYSYFNTVKEQMYSYDGHKVGGEFNVNSRDIPGTGLTASNNELHPSVSMSDAGTFMVGADCRHRPNERCLANQRDHGPHVQLDGRRGRADDDSRHRSEHRVPSQRRITGLHPRQSRGSTFPWPRPA